MLINNAGVLKAPSTITADGLDIRFAVNTLAPYVLARRLLPKMSNNGRIVNLSSAAQAPIDASALLGQKQLGDDMQAYSQSKLGITTWSRMLATELGQNGPLVVSVNPGSLLGTNMVRDAFGIPGNDVGIGADIVVRAALSAEFEGRAANTLTTTRKLSRLLTLPRWMSGWRARPCVSSRSSRRGRCSARASATACRAVT